jgi:hypothetical protein
MSNFFNHDADPERLLWATVIHQAVRDLGHPNSNTHRDQTVAPLENKIWRSAIQLIFSGKEDAHPAWEYSGLDPKAIRAEVLDKARQGVTVGQVGSRESPMGPIDYREVRRLLVRAFDQVCNFYADKDESAVNEMFAQDCRLDFLSMHNFVKRDAYSKGWGIQL